MTSLLFIRSLREVQNADPRFNVENQLIASVRFDDGTGTNEQKARLTREVIDRLRSVPGVQAASAALIMPFSGNAWITGVRLKDASKETLVQADAIAPGFFQTMGIRFLSGRDFAPADTKSAPNVAIVNQAFVKQHLMNRDALGQMLTIPEGRNGERITWQIVGVVADSKHISLGEPLTPVVYRPLTQEMVPLSPRFNVRTTGPARLLASTVRAAIASVAPQAIVEVKTMEENMELSVYPNKIGAALLGSLRMLGLLLASVGLYGILAHTVTQRVREIGIRIALGASAAIVPARRTLRIDSTEALRYE